MRKFNEVTAISKFELTEGAFRETIVDTLKKIANDNLTRFVNFGDGTKLKVDATTAIVLLSLYNKMGVENKPWFKTTISTSKGTFLKATRFAYNRVK